MNLVEALGKEKYNYFRSKFEGWEINEAIIDDNKAFWEIKAPGKEDPMCGWPKVSLYRDGRNMFIYGDYGRYAFNEMTWLGTPQNLRYDALGYQMEKLDFNTKEAIRVFNENLCEKEIREWLAKELAVKWGINLEDAKALADLDADEWIMAEERIWEYFDKDTIRDNFGCFCENKVASIESILDKANDILSIEADLDDYSNDSTIALRVSTYNICEEMEFARDVIHKVRDGGENAFLAALDSTEHWDFADDLRKMKAGYDTGKAFYVALVALEVLGDKLREREAELEEERE